MTFRAFYRISDFFGNFNYLEDELLSVSRKTAEQAAKKCFAQLKKENSIKDFAFRVETSKEFYLIEQLMTDKELGVITVTHNKGNSIETPVKMSEQAAKKLVKNFIEQSIESDDMAWKRKVTA